MNNLVSTKYIAEKILKCYNGEPNIREILKYKLPDHVREKKQKKYPTLIYKMIKNKKYEVKQNLVKYIYNEFISILCSVACIDYRNEHYEYNEFDNRIIKYIKKNKEKYNLCTDINSFDKLIINAINTGEENYVKRLLFGDNSEIEDRSLNIFNLCLKLNNLEELNKEYIDLFKKNIKNILIPYYNVLKILKKELKTCIIPNKLIVNSNILVFTDLRCTFKEGILIINDYMITSINERDENYFLLYLTSIINIIIYKYYKKKKLKHVYIMSVNTGHLTEVKFDENIISNVILILHESIADIRKDADVEKNIDKKNKIFFQRIIGCHINRISTLSSTINYFVNDPRNTIYFSDNSVKPFQTLLRSASKYRDENGKFVTDPLIPDINDISNTMYKLKENNIKLYIHSAMDVNLAAKAIERKKIDIAYDYKKDLDERRKEYNYESISKKRYDDIPFKLRDICIDIENIEKCRVEGLVIHTGKYTDSIPKKAIKELKENIKYLLTKVNYSKIFLETSSGKGTELLYKLEDFINFYDSFTVKERNKLKICVDTCHVFDAGYDPLYFLESIDYNFPNSIGLIHFNDSKNPRGSRKDRHHVPGLGYIGYDRLEKIYEWARKRNIDLIME